MSVTDDSGSTELRAEVLWCIDYIESLVSKGKLSDKKLKELRISRKLLKNPDTPLVKMRQAMRNSCGDYRSKMKAEENEVKLENSTVTDVRLNLKEGNFIKKSSVKSNDLNDKTDFKFNFNIED